MHGVDINTIENVRRVENFEKDEMQGLAMELTHAVYPHDQIYGKYCTIEEYIDCPPDAVYDYLADPYNLAEWTYSMRDFGEMDETGHRNVPAASDPFDERSPFGVGQEGSDGSPLAHRREFDVGHSEQIAGKFELAT